VIDEEVRDPARAGRRHARCTKVRHTQAKEAQMKTIDTQELSTVAGGVSKNDQLTSTLTSVQSSIKDLASQKPSSSGNDLLLPMAMMMAFNRPQAPTVVAAGTAVAPAAGPVINISNRIGRRW
jgi:hypothetical protein